MRPAIQIIYANDNSSPYTPTVTCRHDEPLSLKSMLKREAESYLDETKLTLDKIRESYSSTGEFWEDPDFPANDNSLFPKTGTKDDIEWLRPHEITSYPIFISESASRFDVQQGELGDCWVLAAVASLCMHPQLLNNVVVPDQNFDSHYCGAFLFRFWQFGKWEDVFVDDRLPTRNGQLIFMRSRDTDEFWTALIEKAYAKINGSYEGLSGGSQSEAFTDFTGGICENYELTDQAVVPKLFGLLQRANTMSSLMGCSIDAVEGEVEARLANGLICGHAYSITDVKEVTGYRGNRRLLRIRNPWGDSSEWRGAFSDGSDEWEEFDSDEREALGLTFDSDGEFWMSFEDFVSNFQKLEICHLGPESIEGSVLEGNVNRTKWEMTLEHDSWIKNVSAGGCRNFIDSFSANRQFIVEVTDSDSFDNEEKGSIIVGVMQKDMRSKNMDFWTIGYAIYQINGDIRGQLDRRFFQTTRMTGKSPQFINTRENVGRHRLDPGKYVIIPSTFNPNEEAEFLLRIFSQKPCLSGCLGDKTKIEDPRTTLSLKQKEEDARKLKEIEAMFKVLAGNQNSITSSQLMNLLDQTIGKGINFFETFGSELSRSLLALKDTDKSGRLDYSEFLGLWNDLRIWRKIFVNHDLDKNGSFNAFELREALKEAGFSVTNRLMICLVNRYADCDKGEISFIDFLLLISRLKNAFTTFKLQSKNVEKKAVFTESEYINNTLYV